MLRTNGLKEGTLLRIVLAAAMVFSASGCTKTEDYIRSQLKNHSDLLDPSSAMFRNITYTKFIRETWCGEINAKNQVGGYSGWIPFNVIAHEDGSVFVTILNPEVPAFGASDQLIDATENLNRAAAKMYESECKNTKPASAWIPFWK